MDSLVIHGGHPLHGEIKISGAKNAALPIIAATLLSEEPIELDNVPRLKDVETMMALLTQMGAEVHFDAANHKAHICALDVHKTTAPHELVKIMRASILVLGPLLARFGQARVSTPGGCAIGSRPVDLHLKALEQMGASVVVDGGFINVSLKSQRLKGADITFDTVTVTGTENILMAAVLAKGQTILRNAAREPEVSDLALFLNSMGAKIEGIGSSCLKIEGVEALRGTHYRILPDRIETGTYLAAAAMTSGKITLTDVKPDTILMLIDKLKESGADINCGPDWVSLDMHHKRPKAISIETAPYPAFPTDMQAQILALNSVASGNATVTENVFENRFMHVKELIRLGSHITLKGNAAFSEGVHELHGTSVVATDLRASACLVLAGLAAKGQTTVQHIYHVDRGYEGIEDKLNQLGADIQRVSEKQVTQKTG